MAQLADLVELAPRPDDVLTFWRDAGPDKWFEKNEDFDRACALRLMGAHDLACRGELESWRETPNGALALVILLDQIPRNIFRGTSRAFATDPKALAIAKEAVLAGFDQGFAPIDRQFFYLPFMHSEILADQDTSVALYEALGEELQLRYAHIHRDVIARFGRFPHRNPLLGRQTTPEEAEFLANGGFAG